MTGIASAIITVVVSGAGVAPAVAQDAAGRAAAEQKQPRYQIAVMERVLEGAVEHGATIVRDRLQAVLPAQMLLSDNARVRGFRLEGYGLFFDVEVPSLQGSTLLWSFRTLDQNDLGLDSALKALRAHIEAAGDQNLQQALKRVELQVGPMATPVRAAGAAAPGARTLSGGPATVAAAVDTAPADDPILRDPEDAYRAEIKLALMDAMLDYAGPLAIGPDEWLTIAARRNDDRPRLGPASTDARTMVIRVRGADLAAFRTLRLPREEALKRMEVRLF